MRPGLAFDEKYFLNYAGSGRAYDRVYDDYSYATECIELFSMEGAPTLRSIMVLGAATGRVLQDFEKAFGIKPWGCEISEWAWARIPQPYRGRIARANMLDYLEGLAPTAQVVDLCFTNSLPYLATNAIPGVLETLARHCRYVHFRSSYLGSACPDPHRRTLKPLAWWRLRFMEAGFAPVTGPFGQDLFCWRSLELKP